MRTRTPNRRERIRFSVERRVAPHVDPEWTEAVLLELRMQGVRGDRIGEALAEVDAHCVDSGRPAAEVFGDPVAYARSLDLPAKVASTPRDLVQVVVPVTLQALGMLATIWGLGSWVDGEVLSVTVGILALLGLVLALDLSLLWLADRVLRLAVRRPVLTVVAGIFLPIAAIAALLLLLDHEVATVPAPLVTLAGAALVAVVQIFEVRRARRGDDDDPVVAPLDGPVRPGRSAERVLSLATTWQMPIVTVLMAAVTWWLAAAS